jgi:hypothetical protein
VRRGPSTNATQHQGSPQPRLGFLTPRADGASRKLIQGRPPSPSLSGSVARRHGSTGGFFASRCDGVKPSPSRQSMYFGAVLRPFVSACGVSLTSALSLPFGHRAEVCPTSPQLKQALSLTATFGFVHSCPVWPLAKQLGQVVSALLRAGRSRSGAGVPLPPPLPFLGGNLRRMKACSSSSGAPLLARAAISA